MKWRFRVALARVLGVAWAALAVVGFSACVQPITIDAGDATADGDSSAPDTGGSDVADADGASPDVSSMDAPAPDVKSDVVAGDEGGMDAIDVVAPDVADSVSVDRADVVVSDILDVSMDACSSPRTTCGGSCVDTRSDNAHCGACGRACPSSQVCSGGSCVDIPPPRPIAPSSTCTSASLRPTFRWILPSGVDGARFEFCTDRTCIATVSTPVDVSGSSYTPGTDLIPRRHYFWRVHSRVGSARTGTAASPIWQIRTPARSATAPTAALACNGTVSDINGDGLADAIVSAPYTPIPGANAGSVHMFVGAPGGVSTSPAVTLPSPDGTGTYFGTAMGVGDVNGDGIVDLLVSAPGYMSRRGRLYVFLGPMRSPWAPAQMIDDPTGTGAGFAGRLELSAGGDIDGDGYSDVVIGAGGFAPPMPVGRAFVLRGGPTGLVVPPTPISSPDGGGFGASVSIAGDVNADGFADVLVGASETDMRRGRAYVYAGGPTGLSVSPSRTLLAPEMVAGNFGSAVAGLGDVNGDGYSDITVGAINYMAPCAGAGVAGRAYVYYGSSTGIPATSTTVFGPSGGEACSQFGMELASGQDVNGDGFADVLVSSLGVGGMNYGRFYLFLGATTGLQTSPGNIVDGMAFAGMNGYFASYGLIGPGDVNGDGFDDILVGGHGAAGAGPRAFQWAGRSGTSVSSSPVATLGPFGVGTGFGFQFPHVF